MTWDPIDRNPRLLTLEVRAWVGSREDGLEVSQPTDCGQNKRIMTLVPNLEGSASSRIGI